MMLQSMVHTDIFECHQLAILLIEIDFCPVDDQMKVLVEVQWLLAVFLIDDAGQQDVLFHKVFVVVVFLLLKNLFQRDEARIFKSKTSPE